jgi:hypothetical protein
MPRTPLLSALARNSSASACKVSLRSQVSSKSNLLLDLSVWPLKAISASERGSLLTGRQLRRSLGYGGGSVRLAAAAMRALGAEPWAKDETPPIGL